MHFSVLLCEDGACHLLRAKFKLVLTLPAEVLGDWHFLDRLGGRLLEAVRDVLQELGSV